MLNSTLAAIDPSYPISFGVLLLLLIFIVLLQINAKLNGLNLPQQRPMHSPTNLEHDRQSASTPEIEVPSGTPFDEFLSEDPSRNSLPKKDQFKAYRKWRAEKGLNWSSKD